MQLRIRFNRDAMLTTLMLIIFPLISIVPILYNLTKKNKFIYYILFSCWIGYFWYYYIPNELMDLYKHYYRFETIFKIKDYNILKSSYFGLDLINYILKKNNLNKELIILVSSFIFYFAWGYAFYIFTKKIWIRKIYKTLLLIIYFLSFGVITPTYVRTPISIGFLIIGFLILFCQRKKRGIIYLLLSIAFHTLSLLPSTIFLLSYYFNIDNFLKTRKRIILYLVVCLILGMFILDGKKINIFVNIINEYLPETIKKIKIDDGYLEGGKWGKSYYETLRKTGSFQNYIVAIIINMKVVFFATCIFYMKKNPTFLERKIWLFTGIALLYINFYSFFQRYSIIVLGFLFIIIVKNFFSNKKNKIYFLIFIFYNLFTIFIDLRIYSIDFIKSLGFEQLLPIMYILIR